MKIALLCVSGTVVALLFLWWCMTQIHFRIGSRHLKVLLFGMTIRKIALDDIAYASKREPKGMAESWYSTLKTSHRLLTIERKTGLRKYFCITPQNRYVFLADLRSAIRRVDPTAEWAALKTFEDTTALFRNTSNSGSEKPSEPAAASPPIETAHVAAAPGNKPE
jgi:hypothetical protein